MDELREADLPLDDMKPSCGYSTVPGGHQESTAYSLPTTINVLLVEDSPGDAMLVTMALGGCPNEEFSICHMISLKDASDRLTRQTYDVALLDLNLPDADGVEAVSRIREVALTLPIVVMTGHPDPKLPILVRTIGAQDFLIKSEISGPVALHAIMNAIYTMKAQGGQGESVISAPEDPPSNDETDVIEDDNGFGDLEKKLGKANLTMAETKVALQIMLGFGSKDIARNLSCSPFTINIHRKHIRNSNRTHPLGGPG